MHKICINYNYFLKYAVLGKNNTEVFLFAQFLRCVPNFAANLRGRRDLRGGGGPPSILIERNSKVQLGLIVYKSIHNLAPDYISGLFCPIQQFGCNFLNSWPTSMTFISN